MNQEPSVAEKLQVQGARKLALCVCEREREAWEVSLTEIGHLMLKCTVDSPVIAAGMAKTPPVLYLLIMWSSTGVTSLSQYRLINFTSCHWKRSHSMWDREPGLLLALSPAILPQRRPGASLQDHHLCPQREWAVVGRDTRTARGGREIIIPLLPSSGAEVVGAWRFHLQSFLIILLQILLSHDACKNLTAVRLLMYYEYCPSC